MWLNELKDLYRCYSNFDTEDSKKSIIKYLVADCLKELKYDLFGISLSRFMKDYEDKSFEELPYDVREMFINFNKCYKKLSIDIDNYLNYYEAYSNLYSNLEFQDSLFPVIQFIYSVSKVNEIKGEIKVEFKLI